MLHLRNPYSSILDACPPLLHKGKHLPWWLLRFPLCYTVDPSLIHTWYTPRDPQVFMLTTSLPFSHYSTPALFSATMRTTWLFFSCVTFSNLRHPRDFTSPTSLRGTLYIYINTYMYILHNTPPQRAVYSARYFQVQKWALVTKGKKNNIIWCLRCPGYDTVWSISVFLRSQRIINFQKTAS